MMGRWTTECLGGSLQKIGLEILAHRLIWVGGNPDDLITEPALHAIRRFVRQGDQPRSWPISRRRIYGEDAVFGADGYQVLHEFDLLHIEPGEIYAVICLFGEESAINLGAPTIKSYEAYLQTKEGLSPLYKPGELDSLIRRQS